MIMQASNGRWVLKKKFTFAAVALGVGSVIALHSLGAEAKAADIAVVLSAYGTFTGAILALIFAADITDKKLNGGTYSASPD